MDKNNDFEKNNNQHDLDEYVAKQISNYYGEDVINTINANIPTPPPKKSKRRVRKLYSAISVICAVVFLTGVILFSGIFFVTGVPTLNVDNTPDTASSTDIENPSSSASANDTENESSQVNNFDSDTKSSTDTESSEVKPDSTSTGTDRITDRDSSGQSDSDVINSEFNSRTDNENILTSSQKNSSHYDENSATASQSTTSKHTSNIAETIDAPSRPNYYSMPEIPDEGTVTSIHTDLDNNNSTNPYDNVTTGKQVRAGIGITLMVLSLAVSLVLNKLRIKEES